ncbi:MAG: hypothetical protein V4445_09890 [Pseudomonadota bacterium]
MSNVRALLKPFELLVSLQVSAVGYFSGFSDHFGWQGLVKLAVLGNNRSVRFRHALVGFGGLAGSS